jgi:hypothetical protein
MTIARVYTVAFDNLQVTTDADQDIFEIVNGATKRLVIHAFSLTSAQTTDERARLRLTRRSTTGSGGTAMTEVATDEGNTVAATAAVVTLATTPGTIGNMLKTWRWSQQNELLYLPTPEMREVVAESGRICLNLQTALGGTRSWDGYVTWEEI